MEERAIAAAPCGDSDEVVISYRILDADIDEHLYREAWEWQQEYPEWLKDADPSEPLDVFLANAHSGKQLDLACFQDGEFVAITSFYERYTDGFEMTAWASRKAKWYWLAPGIWEIGNALFAEGGINEIYSVLARFHQANRKMGVACWMEYDGTRRVKVTPKGRIIEWMRYSITRDQWIKRSNGHVQ